MMAERRSVPAVVEGARDHLERSLERLRGRGFAVYADAGALVVSDPAVGARLRVVTVDPARCHDVSGKLMPRRDQLDELARSVGVSFVPGGCGTRKEGPYVWVGRAVARCLRPDGRHSEFVGEYEWDAELRLEEWVAGRHQPPTEIEKAKEFLGLRKFGRARADTGARMRALRAVLGIPTAFSRDEARRPMVFAEYFFMRERAAPEDRGLYVGPAGAGGGVRDVTPVVEESVEDPVGEAGGASPRDDVDAIAGDAWDRYDG